MPILLALAALTAPAHAQEIKEQSSYGQKKLKKAPKRIHIAQFRVMFQLLYSETEVARGGRELGGGQRGDASAGLTLAMQGIDEAHLQQVTDALYESYVGRLTDAGYELVSADEAGKTKFYADYERRTGGTLSTVQVPGFVVGTPTGLEYYVKGTTKKGKEKSTFVDVTYKASADLDGAVIAKVGLVVPFVVDAESGLSKGLTKTVGGVAKVVLQPDLRLEKDPVGAGFTTDPPTTRAQFVYATRRIAADSVASFVLKADHDIPGILEEKKYKATESAQTDLWGAQYGALRVFTTFDSAVEHAQPIPVDGDAYAKAVTEAGEAFLGSALDGFLGYADR